LTVTGGLVGGSPSDESTKSRGAVAVGIMAAAAVTTIALVIPRESQPHGDDLIYERVAEHPLATHTFPFGYRIGLPTLVHVLPFSHDTGFLVAAILAVSATAIMIFALSCCVGGSEWSATWIAIVFATSPVMIVALFRGGRSVDPLSVLFLVAGAYLVLRRRLVLLAVCLVAAATVRETWVFAVVFAYALWASSIVDVRVARTVLIVAAPAIAGYAALRLGLSTVGRGQVVGYAGPFLAARKDVLGAAVTDVAVTARRCFLLFGLLWFVAPWSLRDLSYARRGLVLAGLCAISLSFAADWWRVLVLLAPVVYPVSAYVLRERTRTSVVVLALCLICNGLYLAYMTRSGYQNIRHPRPPAYPIR
jgi:hypothetical protein